LVPYYLFTIAEKFPEQVMKRHRKRSPHTKNASRSSYASDLKTLITSTGGRAGSKRVNMNSEKDFLQNKNGIPAQ